MTTKKKTEERRKDFTQSKLQWTAVAAFAHSYQPFFFLLSPSLSVFNKKEKSTNTRACMTD